MLLTLEQIPIQYKKVSIAGSCYKLYNIKQ